MAEGRRRIFSLPEYIAVVASIYDKRHVKASRKFIAKQRKLFAIVRNDLTKLSVCESCNHYYEPGTGTKCNGCSGDVYCNDAECEGPDNDACHECGALFCEECMESCCITGADDVLCPKTDLCPGCRTKCGLCDCAMCGAHTETCVACFVHMCDDCTIRCHQCGSGPWCTDGHDNILIRDEQYNRYCPTCADKCDECAILAPPDSMQVCDDCNKRLCDAHTTGKECDLCDGWCCEECVVECVDCQDEVCGTCSTECDRCNDPVCDDCGDEHPCNNKKQRQ